MYFSSSFVCDLPFSFNSVFSLEPRDTSTEVVGAKPSHVRVTKQQKEGRKVDICLKPRSLHTHPSHERPHSLADLKMYKDTKILVAKFLEHSSCSLPPEVQQVVNNIKCVIKSDEKHMEEAIFSANVIDQVTEFDSEWLPMTGQCHDNCRSSASFEGYWWVMMESDKDQLHIRVPVRLEWPLLDRVFLYSVFSIMCKLRWIDWWRWSYFFHISNNE